MFGVQEQTKSVQFGTTGSGASATRELNPSIKQSTIIETKSGDVVNTKDQLELIQKINLNSDES